MPAEKMGVIRRRDYGNGVVVVTISNEAAGVAPTPVLALPANDC